MKQVYLNGKKAKGNETIKEGDCLVTLDKIEGVVFKFQSSTISWTDVDSTFQKDVIDAMCELYCQYKKENKTWIMLEITSAYRDAKHQARVMIDTYMHQGRRKMSEIYSSKWDNAVNLISDLYYDGNHLGCDLVCLITNSGLCNYGAQQKSLFNSLPSSEQQAFPPHFNSGRSHISLKGNKDQAKIILEKWIEVSNVLSNHTKRKAVDFSKNNNSQHSDFNRILRNYGLTVSEVYKAGNFHVQYL